jgi:tRNA dimethylallyltransferase
MTQFKQIALIAPTASGKTSLSIEYAKKYNSNILSLDSLSIYKEIDIVSAKPTIDEREGIKHFGIDEIYPNEHFSVTTFIKLYQKAREESIRDNKSLIIVGGTSFYLKTLIDGLSPMPSISEETQRRTEELCKNMNKAYKFIYSLDKEYMKNIEPTDRYRVEKMLNLYFQTNLIPTDYFIQNPPKPTITEPINIYEIITDREILRERIRVRTENMLDIGLIDEVKYLENRYGRTPNCMRAIGIKEVLEYLDGVYNIDELKEKIIINTARLAKRQRTFNRSKFSKRIAISLDNFRVNIIKG